MNCDDPIMADILSWLNGVKFLNGAKNIPFSLNKHPRIKDYMRSYLSDKAIDIENTIVNFQSK